MLNDIKLLSEIYSGILKEDPDTMNVNGEELFWKDDRAAPFFTYNGKVYVGNPSTTHGTLFARMVTNDIFNIPIGAIGVKYMAEHSEKDWGKEINNTNPLIKLISSSTRYRNLTGPKKETWEELTNPDKLRQKLNFLRPLELYQTLRTAVFDYLNVRLIRGEWSPCGRFWIRPAAIYVSTWKPTDEHQKEEIKNAITNTLTRAKLNIPKGGFQFEDEEITNKNDLAKKHVEVDPAKRKAMQQAAGITPSSTGTGSVKTGRVAKKAGFASPAFFNNTRVVGDSFRIQ